MLDFLTQTLAYPTRRLILLSSAVVQYIKSTMVRLHMLVSILCYRKDAAHYSATLGHLGPIPQLQSSKNSSNYEKHGLGIGERKKELMNE